MSKRQVVPMMLCTLGIPLCASCATSSPPVQPPPQVAALKPEPVPIVYDTDIAYDVDDVGALALLHALVDRDEAKLLGVMVSESLHSYDGLWGPPLVDIINTHYGRPEIPIGVYKGPTVNVGRYGRFAEKVVKAGFPHTLNDAAQAQDATKLYRKLLAEASDNSVVIVSSGYLTNLYGLMLSTPGDDSPSTGMELIGRKVREWVCSGGRYPTSGRLPDVNFAHYPEQSAYVINNWPGKVTFGGDELARQNLTGSKLMDSYEVSANPVAMAWQLHNGGKPEPSRDSLAVLYAVRGAVSGQGKYFPKVETGANHYQKLDEYVPSSKLPPSQNIWLTDVAKPHGYLKTASATQELTSMIDDLIAAPPANPPSVKAGP